MILNKKNSGILKGESAGNPQENWLSRKKTAVPALTAVIFIL